MIEITTPVGQLGEAEVRVQAADDPQRFAIAKLRFVDPPPRPYAKHVDRQKIRTRRRSLPPKGLSQAQFGAQVGVSGWRIGSFERGGWNPPDDVIERMVVVLGGTLEDFRK